MPLHHYLPATYLARFSSDENLERRKRVISIGNNNNGKVFQTSVSKVGAINNFYTLIESIEKPELIDNIWERYESNLNESIDDLINANVNAITWARILVPFVTCMLIRSPDFNKRFEGRLLNLSLDLEKLSKDNINSARMMEIQRLLTPILAANWIVFNIGGRDELITNDIGYAPFKNEPTGEIGFSIPLDKKHILGIIPRRNRILAYAENNEWLPAIQYEDLETDIRDINKSISSISQRFIFGSKNDVIKKYLNPNLDKPMTPEIEQLGFIGGSLQRIHEFSWHKLIGVLESKPYSLDAWIFDFKWEKIASGWCPPIVFPTNLPEFPPGFIRRRNQIIVNLYDIEDLPNLHYFMLKGKHIM